MWLPAMVAVLAIGTAVDWSAGGGSLINEADFAKVSSDPIRLQLDPILPVSSGLDRTGVTPRSPLPEDDPALTNPGASKLKSVLVYMDRSLQRASTERANVKAFTAQAGGFVRYEYKTVLPNVMNLRDLTDADIEALKVMPGVVKIEPDQYHPNLVKLDEATPLVRGLQSQITAAGLSADGSGVRVCVCDTGIDMDHIMYADRIDSALRRSRG